MKGGRPPHPLSRTNLKQQLMRHQMEQEERRQRELQSALGTPPASSAICVPGIQERMPAEILVPTQVLQQVKRTSSEPANRYYRQQRRKHKLRSSRVGGRREITEPLYRNWHQTESLRHFPLSTDIRDSLTRIVRATASMKEIDYENDYRPFFQRGGGGGGGRGICPNLNTCADNELRQPSNTGKKYFPEIRIIKVDISKSKLRARSKNKQKRDPLLFLPAVERRRRFNINDRIKELGTLLPRTNDRHYELVRDLRQNKGTILKATVDYVRTLKKETEKISVVEERQRVLEQQNKQLLLRIQANQILLEHTIRVHGISLSSQTWQPTSETQLSALLGSEQAVLNELLEDFNIKNEAPSPSQSPSSGLSSAPSASPGHALGHYEDIMDDDSVACTSDPLLSSSHVLHDPLHSPTAMDYHG
ncbi:unnamed protein product [Ixodes hexagonus]